MPHDFFRYRAATASTFDAAAGSAAFFVISGSATRTRVIRKLRVNGIHLTTLAVLTVVAEKWDTTAFSGGTSAALTRTPLDSKSPAARTDGLVLTYTVAPTEGTLTGTIGSRRVMAKSTTVVDGAGFADVEFDFTDRADDSPVMPSGVALHGTTESLSLAFGAGPATAVTVSLEVEWMEGAGP